MTAMNPRRAWISVVALAAALLAGAVAAATALEPWTRGFAGFRGLDTWKIDVHQHADPEVLGAAVNWAASQGILGIVNLGGGHAGAGLERQLEAAARFPGRVQVFMGIDASGCCGDAWAERESARLVAGRALGARGVHVPRDLADASGVPVPLDAPALAPVWEIVDGLSIPVALHPGTAPDAPGRLSRLLDRHPTVTFLALRFADLASDPAAAGALLDRHANLVVDTGGAIADLGRHPEAARAVIVAHADRVLLGTDLIWLQGPRPELRALILGSGQPVRSVEAVRRFFDSTWRFLETRDPGIPTPRPEPDDPTLTGMGLPRDVLEKLFHGNARRVLGFGDLEAR
jgi:predicted TIM-barrel fold metal-dependent hydrolase